jgi:hypothetical protein
MRKSRQLLYSTVTLIDVPMEVVFQVQGCYYEEKSFSRLSGVALPLRIIYIFVLEKAGTRWVYSF